MCVALFKVLRIEQLINWTNIFALIKRAFLVGIYLKLTMIVRVVLIFPQFSTPTAFSISAKDLTIEWLMLTFRINSNPLSLV